MWSIAYTYHFPPDAIEEMDVLDDLYFWNSGIPWINEQMKNK